jgi:hypothetical protein
MKRSMILVGFALIMSFIVGCEFAVDVTYEFSKSADLQDINPTVQVFNVSDLNSDPKTSVMTGNILSLKISCFEDDRICWGAYSGSTEWGCGKDCVNQDNQYCTDCKADAKIPVHLEPMTGTMTWTIVKDLDAANPTVNFYDVSDSKKAIHSNVKLDQKTTTTSFTCTIGNMICIGADFELAGQDFVIGCGEGCVDYEDYESELKSSKECQACVNGNADQVNYTNFL